MWFQLILGLVLHCDRLVRTTLFFIVVSVFKWVELFIWNYTNKISGSGMVLLFLVWTSVIAATA